MYLVPLASVMAKDRDLTPSGGPTTINFRTKLNDVVSKILSKIYWLFYTANKN